MECSNCREVLESGCSVSAGLRQEDRLILDWEKRHKGRSCSGALRPFGKLKKRLGEAAYPYLSCARDPKSSHKKTYHVCIVFDGGRLASPPFSESRNIGQWSLSSLTIRHSAALDAY